MEEEAPVGSVTLSYSERCQGNTRPTSGLRGGQGGLTRSALMNQYYWGQPTLISRFSQQGLFTTQS